METLITKLDTAIEKKIEIEWHTSRYGEIDAEWKARRIEQEQNRIVEMLVTE